MILHRVVFQAAPGKANEVVAAFKASSGILSDEQTASMQPRIMTDLSGPTDTVVIESTHESLAAYEQFCSAMWATVEERGEPMAAQSLIVSARNEFYTIE